MAAFVPAATGIIIQTHTHTHTSIYLLYITFQLYIFMAEMASQSAGYTL